MDKFTDNADVILYIVVLLLTFSWCWDIKSSTEHAQQIPTIELQTQALFSLSFCFEVFYYFVFFCFEIGVSYLLHSPGLPQTHSSLASISSVLEL